MYEGLINKARRDLKAFIAERLALLVKIRPYTVTSADGTADKVQGYTNDEEKYDLDGQRMWPFGVRSRPPAGVDAVWLPVNGPNHSSHGVIIGAESSGYGPTDLAEGETALYNKVTGTVVKLDADGNVSISTPSGKTVSVNGQTYAMAKWDDGVVGPSSTGFVAAFNIFIAALKAAGSFANIVAAATAMQTAMTSASNYSSSAAQNG